MELLKKLRRKFIRRLREGWIDFMYFFGHTPSVVEQGRGLRILIYHGVCKNSPLKFNSRFLSERVFEKHLIAIKKHYNTISYLDYKTKKFSASKLNVLLTFDDGLRNNFTLALPLLKKYKIPAVFFVCTVKDRSAYLFNDLADVFSAVGPHEISIDSVSFKKTKVGIHSRYVTFENKVLASHFQNANSKKRNEIISEIFQYVSKEQLKVCDEFLELISDSEIEELSKVNGITIGSHGVVHSDFSSLSREELREELIESKLRLEHLTEKICDLIAFPYGAYNKQTIELCKERGYTNLFGTEKLIEQHDRAQVIERITINPFVSAINQMYYIARNNYE